MPRYLRAVVVALPALGVASGPGLAAPTIRILDRDINYFGAERDPCPRGDQFDTCSVEGYLLPQVQSFASPLFRAAWDEFQANVPPHFRRWNVVQGAPLQGTINITMFRTNNPCPDPAGVSMKATYSPAPGEPNNLKWSQGTGANYQISRDPVPHNAPPPAYAYEMDVQYGFVAFPAPLYPYQVGGEIDDSPQAFCRHNTDVVFDAVALLVQVDFITRTVTFYEGFRYGFDIRCAHVEVPAPGAAGVLGGAGLLAVRRRRRV